MAWSTFDDDEETFGDRMAADEDEEAFSFASPEDEEEDIFHTLFFCLAKEMVVGLPAW